MSLKSFIAKTNSLLEKDYMTSIQLIQVERFQLISKMKQQNLTTNSGGSKVIKILAKLKYLHMINVQDISLQVIPIILAILESNYVKSLSTDQLKTLFDCLEIYIKYLKLYNSLHTGKKPVFNNVYADLDYCKLVNKLLIIITEHFDDSGINVKLHYYNLFLDYSYKFLNGEVLDNDVTELIEINYKFLTLLLDKVVLRSIKLRSEKDLSTLNVILFSSNERDVFNSFISLYLENNNDYIKLVNIIIASEELTLQEFILISNFASIKDNKVVPNNLLTNKAINFITLVISKPDLSIDILHTLLIIVNKQIVVGSSTTDSLLRKLSSIQLKKLTASQKSLIQLIQNKIITNKSESSEAIEESTTYKEPHFTQWSVQWDDLIYKQLNNELQDINFIKWVMQSTDIAISASFLKLQYERATPNTKHEWGKLLGVYDDGIDAFLSQKCGFSTNFSDIKKSEDVVVGLNSLLKRRLVTYDFGVLFECEFFKINYIFEADNLKFVVKDIGELKTAEVFIDGWEKVDCLKYKFVKDLHTVSDSIVLDFKLRTFDDKLFCTKIEFKIYLNKFFVYTQDMSRPQFESFFSALIENSVENNEKITIKTDFDKFIIFISKLKKYNIKTINVNNDLYYLYTMMTTEAEEKIGILSKVYLTDTGDWQINTVSTYKSSLVSKLFNDVLSVS